MTNFRVMNRRLDAYSIDFNWLPDAVRWMEGEREYIESSTSTCYGDVLVEMRSVVSGFRLIGGVDISNFVRKPMRVGYRGSIKKTYYWLWFEVGVERTFQEIPYKIVEDFVGDWQGKMVKDLKGR